MGARPQQQQQGGLIADMKVGFNATCWLLCIHAKCLYPAIRCGPGTQSIGFEAMFAGILILFIATQTRSHELLLYGYAWALLLVWRRIRADREQITTYEGWPWAAQVATLGLIRNEFWLRAVEPFLCLAIGYALHGWSPVVGKFVGAGFITLRMKNGIESRLRRRYVESMRDARIMMQQQAEMMRW